MFFPEFRPPDNERAQKIVLLMGLTFVAFWCFSQAMNHVAF